MGWFLRILSLATAALLAACAGAIPTISQERVQPSNARQSSAPLPILRPCILIGERVERRQLEGISDLSFSPWHQAIASIVVHHGPSLIIFDPSFGRSVASDVRHAPLLWQPIMGDPTTKVPIGTLLQRAGIAPRDVTHAAITHVHWDHIGGLRDLPNAQVLLSSTELHWARQRHGYLDHGTMRHHFLIGPRWAPFELDGGPYEGFERSHDLFGDQAIVAVPLPGHTPGSVGYFLNSGDGHRWLVIGDAAWTLEGVSRPAHKNMLARVFVDSDTDAAGRSLGLLHAFSKFRPDITIVPMHDLDGLSTMPECKKEP